jgi:hypothetical protein
LQDRNSSVDPADLTSRFNLNADAEQAPAGVGQALGEDQP